MAEKEGKKDGKQEQGTKKPQGKCGCGCVPQVKK
jgi:hypothetical protein